MDDKKECKIAYCGDPAAYKGRLVVGAKQLRKAVSAGKAACVFLAANADPAITVPLEELCREQGIPLTWVRSMEELGRACGIEVGAAAAALTNR